MVQRLGLAQALLNDPQLLVLDEPTDGLDPRARAEVRQIIRGLTAKGVTIFLNSHLLAEVETTCDRVAILNKGELKYCGSVADIGEFIGGTKKGQHRIELLTKGDPVATNASFDGVDFKIVEKRSETEFRVEATVTDQDSVDALIDSLRNNGVSLISLQHQQISLEDAFLKIVNDHESMSPVERYLK